MVLANLIENGEEQEEMEILNDIEKFKAESNQYAQMADSAKP